jgi:hypothetical protein
VLTTRVRNMLTIREKSAGRRIWAQTGEKFF